MKGLYVLVVVALVANGVLLLVMRREMEQLRQWWSSCARVAGICSAS